MLLRAIGAAALTLSFSSSVTSNALAGSQPGFARRVSCTVVRYYVEKYSASAAETWARSHGATDAQIDAAAMPQGHTLSDRAGGRLGHAVAAGHVTAGRADWFPATESGCAVDPHLGTIRNKPK